VPQPAPSPPAPATSRLSIKLMAGYGLLALGFFAAGFVLPPMLADNSGPVLEVDLERVRLPRPVPVAAFSLEDVSANRDSPVYTRQRLLNQWTLMYFGYTNCPDVCRPTLAVLAEVARRLRAAPDTTAMATPARFETVFVSIDPARDTPAAIRGFLAATGERIVGLRGSEQQIAQLAGQLGIMHSVRSPDPQGGYLVDHPATILLIDPGARLSAGFAMPRDTAQIAAQISEIVADYQAAREG
jgi:protein SCO1/2